MLEATTKEDIFADLEAETEEIYETVKIRGKERIFKIRPFESSDELDAMTTKTRQIVSAAKTGAPPFNGLKEGDINVAVIVSMGVIEPVLTIGDVLKIQKKAAGAMILLMGKILELSGITETKMKEEVKKLDADPFPLDGIGDMPGIFSQASKGNETDVKGFD